MPNIDKDILNGWDVVVIDDDPNSLTVASTVLAHYGASVHKATNGQEGLDRVREVRPRFIVCDISMPVMDGWTFITEIKKLPVLQDIPVIALTAHAMPGDRSKAIAAGFHNHMTKPLTPATFMSDLLLLLEDIPETAQYLLKP
ncbi:MAG: response regulator [Chloroflexota bacterium]